MTLLATPEGAGPSLPLFGLLLLALAFLRCGARGGTLYPLSSILQKSFSVSEHGLEMSALNSGLRTLDVSETFLVLYFRRDRGVV